MEDPKDHHGREKRRVEDTLAMVSGNRTAASLNRNLNETHLILYLAWRKLWMERRGTSLKKYETSGSLSLTEFHHMVASEVTQLVVEDLRLCPAMPDWQQTVKVVRVLCRRGILKLHKHFLTDGETELHVALMNSKVGEDMLHSINATFLEQADMNQQSQGSTEAERHRKRQRTEQRQKIYHIPLCVLELHLEYERRDLVEETRRFQRPQLTPKKNVIQKGK